MNPRLCLLWATLVLPPLSVAQIPQSALPSSYRHPPRLTTRVEVPFKLYQAHLIVVQGSVGSLPQLNFVIDTGTYPTAVDTRIANRLRLAGWAHKLALFEQNIDVRLAVLPSLQLGPIRAESVPVVIQDLSPLKEASGVRVDAIVGLDVLSLSSFSIDYRSKRITFGPIESSPFGVPFDTGPPILTVQLRIQDEPVRLLVDTGTADLVLFECQLRGRVHELPFSTTKLLRNSTGKALEMTEVWLPGLRLGTTSFGIQEALSAADNTDCDRPFDGVVGIPHLGLKWVAFDFEHGTFSWRR